MNCPDNIPEPSRARRARRRPPFAAGVAAGLSLAVAMSAVSTLSGSGPAASATKSSRRVTTAKKPTATTRPAGATPTRPAATTATLPIGGPRPSCGVVKIMPLGDSLTAFGESYRGPLFRQLVADGYRIDFVGSLNWAPAGGGDAGSEGHGGFTIGPDDKVGSDGKPSNIAQNIDAWLTRSKPDVVLLTIGTNDISGGSAAAAQAPGKLKGLVEHMHATNPDLIIVVGDIPPNVYNVKANAETRAVNTVARTLGARSTTDTIFYADTSATLLRLGFDPTTGTTDGTHFTVAVGELFAEAWLPVVRSVLDARRC